MHIHKYKHLHTHTRSHMSNTCTYTLKVISRIIGTLNKKHIFQTHTDTHSVWESDSDRCVHRMVTYGWHTTAGINTQTQQNSAFSVGPLKMHPDDRHTPGTQC